MCASLKKDERRHVFIIGCKGIPARYGGFETFADHLVRGSRDPGIVWHVACQLSGEGADITSAATAWSQMDQTFTTHPEGEEIGTVFFIRVHSKLGKAKAIFYDVDAMTYAIEYCEKHREIQNPVFYLLAYRIGPWMGHFARRIHRLGGQLFLNPDGHEWMRRKWSRPVRIYWKISENTRQSRLRLLQERQVRSHCRQFSLSLPAEEIRAICHFEDLKVRMRKSEVRRIL